MDKTRPEYKRVFGMVQKAAQHGAKVLNKHYGRLHNIREKKMAGLVSEADEASEKVIRRVLTSGLSIPFLGEESVGAGFSEITQNRRASLWIVDPLDGTTNYVHGFPIFCISIALQWEGELLFGYVSVPMLKMNYWAYKGRGAYLNGKKIQVSRRGRLSDSLLATGFFREHHQTLDEQLRIFSNLVYTARGIRRAGAAAYDLCLVAQGVFDAFWEQNLKPWDVAAGALIVQEAGGKVSQYDGGKINIFDDSILASNRLLHSKLLREINVASDS